MDVGKSCRMDKQAVVVDVAVVSVSFVLYILLKDIILLTVSEIHTHPPDCKCCSSND
jgi:hypothetical protein